MLFETFVEETWRPSIGRLRECTRVGYESTLRCHILPKWGDADMDAISVADIESWLDSLLPALTPVTVPYCELISVWVTESYCLISKTCTVTAIR